MSAEPLVSILIPMHNAKPWLPECIDSILKQTVQDFQIILVDDGSDDGSAELADRMAAEYSCLHVIHQKCRGVSAARNTALDQAEGSFLMPVDADDWLEPDCLEQLLALQAETQAPICACNHFIEENGVSRACFSYAGGTLLLSAHDAMEGALYHRIPDVSCWGKLYRRELFDDLRYPEGRLYEDTALFAPVLLRAGQLAWTPKPGYHYRIRPDSISRSVWDPSKLDFISAADAFADAAGGAFPDLEQAGDRRRCHARLSTRRYFVHCGQELLSERKRIEQEALQYASGVLRDRNAPLRDKVALLALRLGPWAYDLLWSLCGGGK